ncbi:hypothetical protein AAHE18_20G116400 [Arachis hypogaea]
MDSTPIENNNETEPNQNDEGQAIEAHAGQEVSQSVQNSPNRKGLTSKAKKHFRREQIDRKWKAICKYCERKIGGDTKQGTKHLHDHIRICPIHTVRGSMQSILKTVQQSSDSTGTERPTDSLLQVGFHEFMAETQPLFKFYTRNTLRSDVEKLYEANKAKLLKLLEKNSSRIAITTDMWSADC